MKDSNTMKRWLVGFSVAAVCLPCGSDSFVLAPTPSGPVGNPYDTSTVAPFLIWEIGWTSMRYQQVYNSSSFTNVDPSLIYITTITFFQDNSKIRFAPWTVDMQINLSTTQKSV